MPRERPPPLRPPSPPPRPLSPDCAARSQSTPSPRHHCRLLPPWGCASRRAGPPGAPWAGRYPRPRRQPPCPTPRSDPWAVRPTLAAPVRCHVACTPLVRSSSALQQQPAEADTQTLLQTPTTHQLAAAHASLDHESNSQSPIESPIYPSQAATGPGLLERLVGYGG